MGSFSRVEERHPLWAEWSVLVGVIQPTSLSNFPAAGAVPPVFPSMAQPGLSSRGPMCKAQLCSPYPPWTPCLPQACAQTYLSRGCAESTAKHHVPCVLLRLRASSHTRKDSALEEKEKEGRKGEHTPVAQASFRSNAVYIRPLHGLSAQPEGKSFSLFAVWHVKEASTCLCCRGARRSN